MGAGSWQIPGQHKESARNLRLSCQYELEYCYPGKFEQYCYDVIDGKRKDDKNLQIGGAFTGEDALKNAEKAAKKIHELHEELSELNKSK